MEREISQQSNPVEFPLSCREARAAFSGLEWKEEDGGYLAFLSDSASVI